MKTGEGFVIAIDGPDGVGKTEQVKILKEYLLSKDCEVHVTRQSGGTPIGERLRSVSLSHDARPPETDIHISLAMGYALARDITARRAKGQVIIIDRSPLAVIAYNGYGSQLKDMSMAINACRELMEQSHIDLLIFLTADKSTIASRRTKRGVQDYYEKQDSHFHDRVDAGYQAGLEFLNSHSKLVKAIEIIDATDDIPTVHDHVVRVVNQLFTSHSD